MAITLLSDRRGLQLLKILILFLVVVGVTVRGVAQTESLLIGPGDLIYVEVFDTPEMTQQVRVTDAGTVRLQLIGELKVAGETVVGAAKMIEKALIMGKVMRQPQVAVKIQEYATQDVSVLGEVKNPGSYPITTAQSILKLIASAGGLTAIADRNITVKRPNESKRTTYYFANDAEEALRNAAKVYPGDTIIVPKAPLVYIMGDVARPGGYSVTTNDSRLTVLQAIAMAGSVNKTSVSSRVRLIRRTKQGQEELPIQLAAIQEGRKPDVALEPDDVIYVPFSWMKNMAVNASSIAASTSSAAIYALH
jgi:polysaccharide export outer membrane protein